MHFRFTNLPLPESTSSNNCSTKWTIDRIHSLRKYCEKWNCCSLFPIERIRWLESSSESGYALVVHYPSKSIRAVRRNPICTLHPPFFRNGWNSSSSIAIGSESSCRCLFRVHNPTDNSQCPPGWSQCFVRRNPCCSGPSRAFPCGCRYGKQWALEPRHAAACQRARECLSASAFSLLHWL